MSPEDRLDAIAADLRQGTEPPSTTVRDFLSWFGAQRRGYWIVASIRDHLRERGLETKPDFELAFIDSSIQFVPAEQEKAGGTTLHVDAAGTESDLILPASYADPRYRISRLAAANRQPVSVAPTAPLEQAVTLMLANDFSQLPVMTSPREVKGTISWKSMGTRLALGRNGTSAQQFMDTHQEISAHSSLYEAIPIIVRHDYVLVRGGELIISGIITASDLSDQFGQLAEPFILLGEIENQIRRMIASKFTNEEFKAAQDPADSDREGNGAAALTFGEYVRLLQNPERWARLQMPIDRATFIKELDQVRAIRNDVMHFDPDGILPDQLERLREFSSFLDRLHAVGVAE